MKIVKIPIKLWRKLALEEFFPRPNFVEVMKNRYGLVRVVNNDTINDLQPDRTLVYEIVDEQKYMMFVLTWGEYLK